jgi:peptidoglycan/LPS O-acetylase OafA/YrhL
VDPRRIAHVPALDGVRAVAVLAVIAYHADLAWLPGGFLGVDVFFVVSGYLICALMVRERAATGSVSLRGFWARRARRLLPALYLMLVTVSLLCLVVAPDAVARLRGDLAASVLNLSNWWQIGAGQSYFEEFGRPPLLRHLWSLAVEEQFYLGIPLVMSVLLGRVRSGTLALAALAGAAGSALLMAALWSPDADVTRVYFGTDTRLTGLFLGVALALASPPSGRARRRRGSGPDLLGWACLACLAVMAATVTEASESLYRGGFALVAVLSVGLVAGARGSTGSLAAVLGHPVLRWVGTRSYAIYLWHWPVLMLSRPGIDIAQDGWPVRAAQLAAIACLAEISWHLVERPFRSGRAARRWILLAPPARQRVLAGTAAAGLAVVLLLGTAPGPRAPSWLPASVASGALSTADPEGWVPRAEPTPTTVTSTTAPSTTTPPPTAAPAPAPPPPTTAPRGPIDGAVFAVGDSVLVAASRALTSAAPPGTVVDAQVARQNKDTLDALEGHRDRGELQGVGTLLVHIGTNGLVTDAQMERLASIAADVPRIVVMNVRVPRSWEQESNASITAGVARHPNMRMADWYAASAGPGVIGPDGVHPTAQGAQTYAEVALAHAATAPPPTTTTTTAPTTTTSTAPPPPPTTAATAATAGTRPTGG